MILSPSESNRSSLEGSLFSCNTISYSHIALTLPSCQCHGFSTILSWGIMQTPKRCFCSQWIKRPDHCVCARRSRERRASTLFNRFFETRDALSDPFGRSIVTEVKGSVRLIFGEYGGGCLPTCKEKLGSPMDARDVRYCRGS